jgi:hypothetical protein
MLLLLLLGPTRWPVLQQKNNGRTTEVDSQEILKAGCNQQVNPLPAALRMTRDDDICSWVAAQS